MAKSKNSELSVWNRYAEKSFFETIYGERPMRALYGNYLGRIFTEVTLTKPWISKIYGRIQASSWSKRKIKPFVARYGINMSEFEQREFVSFNDFFTRKFIPSARPIATPENIMAAPAEARYLGFSEIRGDERVPVKGFYLSISDLLDRPEIIKIFSGGPLLLARLCPTDYHRYHFPDSGKILDRYRIAGPLHSVNPIALAQFPYALCQNERAVTLLETKNFGKLALVAVGALMVGRIEERKVREFSRGEEYGKFLFGGSTVIIVGEKGAWKPNNDLLKQTAVGRETFIRLGDAIAQK